MMKNRCIGCCCYIALVCFAALSGCGNKGEGDGSGDLADTETGGDTGDGPDTGDIGGDLDADADGDADGDTDTDGDTDADGDGDGDGDGPRCVGTPTGSCTDAACAHIAGCNVVTAAECTGDGAPCSTYDGDRDACREQWGCEPSVNAGLCYTYYDDCWDFDMSDDCERAGGCRWEDWSCLGEVRDCGEEENLTACKARSACRWEEATVDYCTGTAIPCGEMDAEDCDTQSGCTLVPGACGGTPTHCESLPLDECRFQPGCEIEGDSSGIPVPYKEKGATVALPDLVIDTMNLRRAEYEGEDSFMVDLEIVNRGVVDSGPFNTDFIFSSDEILGNEDDRLYVKSENTYAVEAFGMNTIYWRYAVTMADIAAEFPSGYYYMWLVVDSDNQVEESEEDNNLAMTDQIFFGVHSNNLAARAVSLDATAGLSPDTEVGVSVTVQNLGTQELSAIPVQVFLSADAAKDESDAVLCDEVADTPVAVNGEMTVTFTCTVPRIRGEFTPIAEVDGLDTLADTDRSDNVAVGAAAVSVTAPSPELVVSDVASDLTEIDWQGSLSVSATVTNSGVDDAGAHRVGFYLSSDQAVDSADVLLCQTEMATGLAAGATEAISESCTAPESASGNLWLIAMADPDDAVFEVDDTNNAAAAAGVITINPPDWNLNASNFSSGSSTIQTGDSVQFNLTVTNTGTVAVSGYHLEVYLSADQSISSSDSLFCYMDKGSLDGGVIDTFTFGCEAPTVDPGTYYFGVLVDPAEAIAETDEGDNAAVYDLMTVEVL